MNCAGVSNEVETGPRAAGEELMGKHVALEAVAPAAGRHEVARGVGAATCKRVDVIERGVLEDQVFGAVDAASSAVAECRVLQRALGITEVRGVPARVGGTAPAGRARTDDPEISTSRHRTSPEKTTPRPGRAGAG